MIDKIERQLNMNAKDYHQEDAKRPAKTAEEAIVQEDEDSADELPDLQAVTYGNYNDLEDLD